MRIIPPLVVVLVLLSSYGRSFNLLSGTMSPDGTISRQAMENAIQFASQELIRENRRTR
jgi:hypothetical protein